MNDWIRNTRDKISPRGEKGSPKNLDVTLKKIVRAKKEREGKRDFTHDRTRNSLNKKPSLVTKKHKIPKDLFQKKFKTFMMKNSIGILKKNTKRLSSFDRNKSTRKSGGFLQRVINSSQIRIPLTERKSSATKKFRKNAQNQYFAMRKMIKEKSVEYRNSATKDEKRSSIKNVMQNRFSNSGKKPNSSRLNSSYSLDELHRKYLARSRAGGRSRFEKKMDKSKNYDSSINSNAKNSRREYSMGMRRLEAKFKKRNLEKNHSALLRKFSNNSKLLLSSQRLGSVTPRISETTLDIGNLNRKVQDRIIFQKYRMTLDY